MNQPLVTIITPTYNRADYLPETIESVLSQDYPNIEYIVLDDGSKDNTLEIIKKYSDKIIIEAHANIGETKTVNKGFRMAKGEFICVVNSDDPLLPGAISKMISTLLAEPDALAVYPDWVEIDAHAKPIKEMKLPDYDILNMVNDFNVAMGPGNIFRRSVLEKYGFRDTRRKYTGDLEFWFRLASHGRFLHIPEILATHRTHPRSASVSDKSSKMAEELLSMIKSLFASGILPKEFQDNRRQILSQAYHVSTFYCQNEPATKRKYALLSFLYNPRPVLRNLVKSIFYRILIILHKFLFIAHMLLNTFRRVFRFRVSTAAAFFRAILPKESYNKLRAWWRILMKTNI